MKRKIEKYVKKKMYTNLCPNYSRDTLKWKPKYNKYPFFGYSDDIVLPFMYDNYYF